MIVPPLPVVTIKNVSMCCQICHGGKIAPMENHYALVSNKFKWRGTSFFFFFFLNWSVCVCSVAQSCLTLCDPMDCSPPVSSGIFQARILEWVAISYCKGSSQPRDWTQISCISCTGRWILYHWATFDLNYYISFRCTA